MRSSHLRILVGVNKGLALKGKGNLHPNVAGGGITLWLCLGALGIVYKTMGRASGHFEAYSTLRTHTHQC